MAGLHKECVSDQLFQLILEVCSDPYFHDFRLFGGTSLALQIGHRLSIDADFITDNDFNKKELSIHLQKRFMHSISNVITGDLGVFAQVNGLKLDFLSWKKPFIRPTVEVEGISLMHLEEIIAHKLFAILNRGEKKDYADIASLMERYSLSEMIAFYQEKFNGSNSVQIIKYLLSYSDIEHQPLPNMRNGMDWEEMKTRLKAAVEAYQNG